VRVWGVDGTKRGWVAVWLDDDRNAGWELIESAAGLAALDTPMVMIDIPIGLPDSGYRGCDLAARRLLGKAAARVFLGLRRPLLGCLHDYKAANAWAKSDGKGLAKQSFNILPKIAAIDSIMAPARQRWFRESHPELAFRRLNGGAVLPSKHSAEGLRLRQQLLTRLGFTALPPWLKELRGTGIKPDDLFDACVLALAARDAANGRATRVDNDTICDSRGLRMEIWY
jgi:predicted RNase H-like nuclease